MRQIWIRFFLIMWSIGLATTAQAEVYVGDEIEVEFVAETENVVPGQTLWTAIRLDPSEHWHTYSKWPGDSGEPTFVTDWELPEGAVPGEIHWPVPEWLPFPGSDLVTFSYEREVFLMIPIEIPEDIQGDQFNASTHVYYQVCEMICIIDDTRVSLQLPIERDAEPRPDAQWASAMAEERDNWPEQVDSIDAMFAIAGDRVSFSFASNDELFEDSDNAWFFPEQRRILKPGPLRDVTLYPGLIQITHGQPRRMLTDAESVAGLLAVENDDGSVTGYEVNADVATPDGLAAMAAVAAEQSGGSGGLRAGNSDAGPGLLLILGGAILGGLILNLMPCVFPVLSLKALSLTSKSGKEAGTVRLHGLLYTAGVIIAFLVLATVLLGLRAGGEAVGWAFQLQSPWFVALLVFLFFVMGLSLSGVYEFGGGLMGLGSGLTQSKGYKSSFFTGVLATVVASPCTAPFMGAALGFALSQPWLVAMLVFVALGLGMALPFLILSFSPTLLRYMPKPGAWMETFKEFMAFPMYATALWLLWVLGVQVGINGMIAVAAAALLLALALWVLQKGQHAKVTARRVGLAFSLVLAVLALSVLRMPMLDAQSGMSQSLNTGGAGSNGEAAEFEPFSMARLEELRNEGQPVLVNMTAAWCITCLANEQTTLSTTQVKNAMEEHGITYLKGDWTNQDPEITQMLDMYNRPSVPLYLLYSGDPAEEPKILPQLLTPSIVIDAFASM